MQIHEFLGVQHTRIDQSGISFEFDKDARFLRMNVDKDKEHVELIPMTNIASVRVKISP
jgi:hypothetical protein